LDKCSPNLTFHICDVGGNLIIFFMNYEVAL
jgi:hypothetical protein